jgi:hypothetical protein
LRWKELCHHNEEFDEHWIDPNRKFDSFNIKQEFPIDSVLLLNYGKTLISGSRDRSIIIKDIQNIERFDNLAELPCTSINVHEVSTKYCTQSKIYTE